MLAALKQTMLGLLSSKKAVMGILTLVAMLGARYGLNFTAEHAFELVSPLIGYVLAQGIADHGQATADAAATNAKLAAAQLLMTAGTASNENHTAAHLALRELAAG